MRLKGRITVPQNYNRRKKSELVTNKRWQKPVATSKIYFMQSNKTSSRKPRETAAANTGGELPEGNTTAPAKKARTTAAGTTASKSSKAAAPATRHRKAANIVSDAVAAPNDEVAFNKAAAAETAPKTMAAASGAGAGAFHSDVVQSFGHSTEPTTVAREEIAALAHSYWLERGGQHGSHENDWFRAEQALKARK
jgi:DUF2934 family protein